MSKLVDRLPSPGTLYPVEIPGHVWKRRFGRNDTVTLYFTRDQIQALRASAATAILKANKHKMGDK